MTTLLTRIAPIVLGLALTVATPLTAATLAPARAPVRTVVAVAPTGLDLSRADGRAAFDARIWTAIVDACGTASLVDLQGQNDVTACRADARAAAARQRDEIFARATLASQPVLAAR